MPENQARISKSQMSAKERQLRSELAQLLSGFGLVRASLNPRQKVCGKPTCRCTRGHKHPSLYLTVRREGKTRQLFIPHSLEPQAQQWVENYQRLRQLLDELSEIYWDKLKRREP